MACFGVAVTILSCAHIHIAKDEQSHRVRGWTGETHHNHDFSMR